MKHLICVVLVFPLCVGCLTVADTPPPVVEMLPDGTSVVVLSGHADMVNSAVLFSNSKKIFTTSISGTVRIWDSESGKELKRIQGSGVASDFFPDGERIVEVERSGVVTIWDSHSGQKLATISGGTGAATIGGRNGKVAVSQDGRKIAMDAPDTTIRIWDVDTEKELRRFEGLHHSHKSLLFSPDGKKILAEWLSDYAIYDTDTGKELLRLEPKWHRFLSVVFSTDGKTIIVAEGGRGHGRPEIVVCDIDSRKVLQKIALGMVEDMWESRDISHVAFSPDRAKIITARSITSTLDSPKGPPFKVISRIVQIWDANSGGELHRWEDPGSDAWFPYFSPDGKKLVTVSFMTVDNGTDSIRIYDTDSGRKLKKIERDDSFNDITFSPDGKRVVVVYTRRANNDVISTILVLE